MKFIHLWKSIALILEFLLRYNRRVKKLHERVKVLELMNGIDPPGEDDDMESVLSKELKKVKGRIDVITREDT